MATSLAAWDVLQAESVALSLRVPLSTSCVGLCLPCLPAGIGRKGVYLYNLPEVMSAFK
jgi:hypothetical protein